jgi:hypothetical protein
VRGLLVEKCLSYLYDNALFDTSIWLHSENILYIIVVKNFYMYGVMIEIK